MFYGCWKLKFRYLPVNIELYMYLKPIFWRKASWSVFIFHCEVFRRSYWLHMVQIVLSHLPGGARVWRCQLYIYVTWWWYYYINFFKVFHMFVCINGGDGDSIAKPSSCWYPIESLLLAHRMSTSASGYLLGPSYDLLERGLILICLKLFR